MREQQAGRQTGLRIFSAHTDKRAASTARIVVDPADQIFLPTEQLELLANEPALGDEANSLNELNNIRRANDVVRCSPLASRHQPSPLFPTAGSREPAPSVSQPRAIAAGNAA